MRRVVLLLLGLPLALIAVGQVLFVPRPVILIDLVPALVISGAAFLLTRALGGAAHDTRPQDARLQPAEQRWVVGCLGLLAGTVALRGGRRWSGR